MLNLLLLSIFSATAFYLLHKIAINFPSIPFSITVILGSALAIFIAFRNNSSYARWWEARNAWAAIQSGCRNFIRQIIANTEVFIANGKKDKDEVNKFRLDLFNRQIAYIHSLRLMLRNQSDRDLLSKYLGDEEFKKIDSCDNIPNKLLFIQTMKIKEGMSNELLGAFDNISLEPVMLSITNNQTICEKIKNTPLQRHYDYFARIFLYIFIFFLPLSLMTDLIKMNIEFLLITLSLVISFVYATIGKVGEVNEEPFENKINDVPMNKICFEIEQDYKDIYKNFKTQYIYKAENDYVF